MCFCPRRLKTHLTSNPLQEVLSPEEYEKVQAEYRQNQIQAKTEGSDAAAGVEEQEQEEEERPPGEDNPANNGTDLVINLKFNVRR